MMGCLFVKKQKRIDAEKNQEYNIQKTTYKNTSKKEAIL